MDSGQRWRLGYRPALDGLRGVAIVLVIAAHYGIGSALGSYGPAGVTAFFVLSGFLITSLLLDERARTGVVSLGAFYLRRARRLLPALAVLLVFVGATDLAYGRSLMGPLAVAFYVGNWYRATGHSIALLNHTWSLAVEEQFYIVWPLVLLAALRWGGRRGVCWVAVAGVTGSVALRLLLWDGGGRQDRIWFGSDTNAVGLLAGCALAAWMSSRSVGGRNRPGLAAVLVGVLAVGALGRSPISITFTVPFLAVVVTTVVLWLLCRGEGSGGLFDNRVLRFVGRRSYAYYLWHIEALRFSAAVPMSALESRLLALALTAGLAEVSWRYVEEPFLRWKRQGASADRAPVISQARAG